MAYVQCVHCRRSAVTVTGSASGARCVRCGAPLPNPAGSATLFEPDPRVLAGVSTLQRGAPPSGHGRRVAG